MNSATASGILKIEDLVEGQFYEEEIPITQQFVDAFISLSGDRAPVHVDAAHAAALGYGARLAHGFLVASCYSRLLGMHLPGGNTIIQKVTLDMLEPVFVGDVLTCRVEVKRVVASVRSTIMRLTATNTAGSIVNRGEATCVYRA